MKSHTWIKEYVDGGSVGGSDFWLCTECGCCGGGADWDESVPSPFLPGPAQSLSEDCSIAHEQISYFILGILRQWGYSLHAQEELGDPIPGSRRRVVKKRWQDVPGADKYILLSNANKWTPRSVKRVEFHRVMFDWQRLSLADIRKQLVGLGFVVEPRKCTTCPSDNDRPGDDLEVVCYTCAYKRDSANRKL